MNLAFNELSFRPFLNNEVDLLDKFKILIEIKKKYGFKNVLFPSSLGLFQITRELKFNDWISNIDNKNRNSILALYRSPYCESKIENESDLDNYHFENNEMGFESEICIGLSSAHILEIPSISLSTHTFWENENIEFFKNQNENVSVFNVPTILENPKLNEYVENNSTINLIETNILPKDKQIHLRDDHGKNILEDFAKRLVNSQYIIEIINSLPFNSHSIKFIRKCYSDGKIEIVLFWEDKGYGMVIQTTGRNLRETEAIAEIIKDKYSK